MDCNVTTFSTRGWFPISFTDRATLTAAGNSYRRVVLLGTVDSIGKVIVGRDAVKLRGGLVEVGRKIDAVVVGNLCAAIVGHDKSFGIVRVDPQIVMVTVGSADRGEVLAAVIRPMELHIQNVDAVSILRICVDACVVPSALS